MQRRRPIRWHEPLTVANDRAGGGVRYQDGVAVAAVQLLGKAHAPTLFTGSTSTYTENAFDIADLLPLLHQSLGLRIDSLSVVSAGARRRSTGDYARVYDTLIGTPPYAGQRETWLIVRIDGARQCRRAAMAYFGRNRDAGRRAADQRGDAPARHPRESRDRHRHRRDGAAARPIRAGTAE